MQQGLPNEEVVHVGKVGFLQRPMYQEKNKKCAWAGKPGAQWGWVAGDPSKCGLIPMLGIR